MILFFSCKKDKSINEPETPEPTLQASGPMQPLAVGNYWIYQLSSYDSAGAINLQNEFDSVYVAADTLISGAQYYKIGHTNTVSYAYYYNFGVNNPVMYIKDSLGFLVSLNHDILLDKVHLHDTIQKTVYSIYEYSCEVPNTFTQKQFLSGIHSGVSMDIIFHRTHPANTVTDTSCVQYYVENIGIVRTYYSFAGCLKQCRFGHNLVRYHLN